MVEKSPAVGAAWMCLKQTAFHPVSPLLGAHRGKADLAERVALRASSS
jgi:hypothetical protein